MGEAEEGAGRRRRRWEDMPADCLVHVFARLPLEELAAAAPPVCRSWRAAALDPSLWRALDLRRGHPERFMPFGPLAKAFASAYGVRRFAFAGFLRLCVARSRGSAVELQLPPLLAAPPASELDVVSIECPLLRKVALPQLLAGDEARLPEIIGRWRHLEELELEAKPSSFAATAAQIGLRCSNFAGLTMVGSIQREDAMAVVTSLPNLRFLCLDKSYLPKEELLLLLSGCRELEVLSARNCVGFDEKDEEVATKTKGLRIKRLELGGSRLVDEYLEDLGFHDEFCDCYVDVI